MTSPYRDPEPCLPTMHSFWLDGAKDEPQKMQMEATLRLNAGQVLVFVCKRCKASLPIRDGEYARETANTIARFARMDADSVSGGSPSALLMRARRR